MGQGGMGHVLRVRHIDLGKPYALKIITPTFADDVNARLRFNQEARLASAISHPNIVSVVDFGEDPEVGAYMVMELVEGETLVSAAPMSIRRACDVLAQIADALDHIHRRGIIHGDVKADNIILVEESEGPRRRHVARLLDFGLARRAGHEVDPPVSGTPHYLAPEVAIGGALTPATDVYALGVLGYLMLTGTLPFDGDDAADILLAHIRRAPEPPSRRSRDTIDPALEAMILRAMAKDVGARHPDVATFRSELDSVMDMLELRRRRSSQRLRTASARETAIAAAFETSTLAQALVRTTGLIIAANRAFAELVAPNDEVEGADLADTSITRLVPTLVAELRRAHVDGVPREHRVRVDPQRLPGIHFDISVVLVPLAATAAADVHVMVRVDEIRSQHAES